MADNYYDATGTLVLDRVTPVIEALFGGFNLDGNFPGDGECYIATISEDNLPQWDDIRDALAALAAELGLSPVQSVDDGGNDWVRALCAHFGVQDGGLPSDIASREDSVRVGDVFDLAQEFDDGHGLKAIKLEGCWHCSKPRLFEFGGAGHYIATGCRVEVASGDAIEFGVALQGALDGNNLDQVAAVAVNRIDKILGSIRDEGTREAVRQKVATKLATATGQEGC